jgi:hypothetical protein
MYQIVVRINNTEWLIHLFCSCFGFRVMSKTMRVTKVFLILEQNKFNFTYMLQFPNGDFKQKSTAADHATIVAQEKHSFSILTSTPVSFYF